MTHAPALAMAPGGHAPEPHVPVFTGEARADTNQPAGERLDAYFKKYDAGIKQLNMTRESISQTYSTTIYLTPARVTGH